MYKKEKKVKRKIYSSLCEFPDNVRLSQVLAFNSNVPCFLLAQLPLWLSVVSNDVNETKLSSNTGLPDGTLMWSIIC